MLGRHVSGWHSESKADWRMAAPSRAPSAHPEAVHQISSNARNVQMCVRDPTLHKMIQKRSGGAADTRLVLRPGVQVRHRATLAPNHAGWHPWHEYCKAVNPVACAPLYMNKRPTYLLFRNGLQQTGCLVEGSSFRVKIQTHSMSFVMWRDVHRDF